MRLECAECERLSDENAVGWEAHLAFDSDGGDEVIFFCSLCATREFGYSKS
jgi:hypothetical protein